MCCTTCRGRARRLSLFVLSAAMNSHSHSHGHHSHGSHSHASPSHHSHHHAPPPPPPYVSADAHDAPKEEQHKATVTATFDRYLQQALSANQRRRADLYALPDDERELLDGLSELLNEVCCRDGAAKRGQANEKGKPDRSTAAWQRTASSSKP